MNYKINKILFLGFSLRILIAIWNGFYGPSFGAEGDAFSFHLEAYEYSLNPKLDKFIIGWFYSYILGYFYYFTLPSLFLGSALSCITWYFSAIYLIKIMDLLKYNKFFQYKIILFYVLLPSSLLYTSVTLREVYQLFFINLSIYCSVIIIIKNRLRYWIILFLSVAGMGVLHGALLAFGIILVVSVIFLITINKKNNLIIFRYLIFFTFIVSIVSFSMMLFEQIAYKLNDGLMIAILNYQDGSLSTEARAHYKNNQINEISNLFSFILFIFTGFIQYLFEPFPWKISSILDLVALLENIFRGWLILNSLFILKFYRKSVFHIEYLILYCYLIIEIIWSFGTVNWGTAMRHHLPSYGILLIASYAFKNKLKFL